jgi:hypothetical protein
MADHNPLRPEASPIPYWKHHKTAKESLDFIIRILESAAGSVEDGKGIEGDDSIDTNRASRIVFVSGEPGSGKSTLYLTLRAMLSSSEYRKGYKGDLKLEKVRWLDPLDLEVAGDEGENLLAAVLVRLIEELTSRGDVSKTAFSKNCEEAIKDLEELATDIGIAWEGNLLARAGELDPDTYSEEVMRTQRARLGVNKRLNKALNDLAKNECFDCKPGTFFVLPVDDFYLKPDASLQLLRLLRMISIPRLFFLVMGDINTIEALFIEKSLADWTSVAGRELFAERPDRLDSAITRATELRARYLRKLLPPGQRAVIEAMDWFEALDFELSQQDDSAETLEQLLEEVELDSPLNDNEQKTDSLHTFLISPSIFPQDLEKEDRKKLIRNEKLKREKRAKGENDASKESDKEFELKKHRSAYTALQILDATPREIMDLSAALREVKRRRIKINKAIEEGTVPKDKKKIPVLLSSVRDIVNLVREENSFLNEKEQEFLEQVLPTRVYSHEDINFAMDRLCLKPSQRTWNEKIKETKEPLWIREHYTWDITVNDDSNNKNVRPNNEEGSNQADEDSNQILQDQFAKLPPRPAAWFVLLHDLAWKWSPESIKGNLVKRLCKELNDWKLFEDKTDQLPNRVNLKNSNQKFYTESKVELDPSDFFLGWAVWQNTNDTKQPYEHFPMPDFKTFRELDRFLYVWSRGVRWLEDNKGLYPNVQKRITSLWALAGQSILLDEYNNFGEVKHSWYKDFAEGEENWFKIFMETGASRFEGRFEEFKKNFEEEREIVLDYPKVEGEQYNNWKQTLDDWTEKITDFEGKVLVTPQLPKVNKPKKSNTKK